MSNVEVLKQGYQNFAAGNIEAVIAFWKEDMEWTECTGFPFVHGDGKYVGARAIIEGVFSNIPKYYDGFNIEISDFVDGGDRVVMVGNYTGTWKPTGKKFKANATHTWTFEDGKATRFYQAVDTAAIINP